jgi:hypothetical protein
VNLPAARANCPHGINDLPSSAGNRAGAMEKALAEHIAAYSEDASRTVEDFNWILRTIIDPQPNSSSP